MGGDGRARWFEWGHAPRPPIVTPLVHSGEQLSFPMNVVSCCSKQSGHNTERYAANCVLKHDRLGGGSVMVWAGIRHDGRTALVRVNGAPSAQVYLDEIPEHHVVPPINVTGGIFQHDNALNESTETFYSKQR